jgi:Family of unknown function (DUF5681)
MPFKKGQSGNIYGGEKPFRDALRMEIADAGDDRKLLRKIAKRLLEMAEKGDMPAISMLADRLDGKPAQESTVTLVKRDENDWSRAELVAIIRDSRKSSEGTAAPDGRGGGSNQVH